MTGRTLRNDILDWWDRTPKYPTLTIITTFTIGAILIGAVTPEARGETHQTAGTPSTPAASEAAATTTAPPSTIEQPPSSSLDAGASDATHAERAQTFQVAPIPTAATPDPAETLTGCDLLEYHASEAGLPDEFGWIGFKESSCRNDVSTWCCHGYWQIHYIHIGAAYTTGCDVTQIADMKGANPAARRANACMARAVLEVQGVCAWDVVRC